MKRILFLCIILFAIKGIGLSQKPPVQYGKLSENDINLNLYEGADAVILCDFGEYYFSNELRHFYFYKSRHLRIKILTEEGLKYTKQTIPYYDLKAATYFRYSQVCDIKAQTLNMDKNGKIKKTKLKYKYIDFHETDSNYNTSLTLNFQNVKVGSIIEYRIRIPTIEIVNLDPWYLQYDIPVLWNEIRIETPQLFNYEARSYNTDRFDISETRELNIRLNYYHASNMVPGQQIRIAKSHIPAYQPNEKHIKYREDRMFIKIMLNYATRKFMYYNMNNLYKAIDPSYKYLNKSQKKQVLESAGFILYKAPDLERLPVKLSKDPAFGPPLVLNMGLKDTLATLTQEAKSTKEKVDIIYDFVTGHMEWNQLYRSYVTPGLATPIIKVITKFSKEQPKLNLSLNKPFRKEKGTSSEINFMFINLLKSMGIKAYPVLISTMEHEYLDPEFFNMHQFNHVLALVELEEGKQVLMDAVQKEEGTILTADDLNPQGLVIKLNKAYWINLIDYNPEN